MTINIFDVYYADLSENTVGSEQGGVRPVVIMQNNIGNKYSPTVIVIPITSEIKKVNMPTHCVLRSTELNGLTKASMALGEQIRMVDKSRLIKRIGSITNEREKADLISVYMANLTGKKDTSFNCGRIVGMLFRLIKEGASERAVQNSNQRRDI